MELIINNHIIKTPILTILNQVKSELNNGKLKDILDKHSNIRVTCPNHNNGKENHPSCGIYCNDDSDIPYGYFNCFTCGVKGNLAKFIGYCFDTNENFGKEWLLSRFGSTPIDNNNNYYLKPIENIVKEKHILDESILDSLQSYHPYMKKRKLSLDIINKFKIRYDPKDECILFPIWDKDNNLVMLTKRSIHSKYFYIDENVDKPVYLYNYINNDNIEEVYVCESQINTLYAWSLGLPAIGLLGTGSSTQYKILNKSNIKRYILALDADEAGRKGIIKFLNNIRKDVIIDVLEIPIGKDLNDLTEEEVFNCNIINIYDYIEKQNKRKYINVLKKLN